MATWKIIKKETKAGVAGPTDWIQLHYFAISKTKGDIVFNSRVNPSTIAVTNYGQEVLVEGLWEAMKTI